MSELRKQLLDLAEKKEIRWSITKIKRAKEDELQKIWSEIQQEKLSETNELIANTFIEKLCDILESTNIIDSGKETANKLKDRKAFMVDVKHMAGYFSSLVPYIGMVEGGIVLGKDVYDHSKNPRIIEIVEQQSFSNKNEKAESSFEEGKEQNFSKEQPFEQDSQDN